MNHGNRLGTHGNLFEGVCVNYRNPDPRRGEPRVGSAPDVAFPVDPLLGSAELREAQKLLVFTCFSAHLAGIGDLFLVLTLKNLLEEPSRGAFSRSLPEEPSLGAFPRSLLEEPSQGAFPRSLHKEPSRGAFPRSILEEPWT